MSAPTVIEGNSVRFSHPVVSSTNLALPRSTEDLLTVPEEEESHSKRDSAATDDTELEPLPAFSQHNSHLQIIRPKQIFRYSCQSVAVDGSRENFSAFKNRLDGHNSRADRGSVFDMPTTNDAPISRISVMDRPPSLQYIARSGTINLDNEIRRQSKSIPEDDREVQEHRQQALSSLEGLTAETVPSRYVLAIVPRTDLPITAVQLSSDRVPSSLLPGGLPQEHPARYRPRTFAAPSTADAFQAYSSLLATEGQGSSNIEQVPEEQLDFTAFDSVAEPAAHHSRHYQHVESAIFDEAAARPFQLPTQASRAKAKAPLQTPAERTYYMPPTPPSSDGKSTPEPIKAILRKPVTPPQAKARLSKPLPDTPGPSKRASEPGTPLKMTDNGYPTLTPHPSKRFSAQPRYQHRYVNDVEAKYKKEQQMRKLKKSRVANDDAYPNALRKPASEGSLAKKAKTEAKAAQIDGGLKKLMLL